MSDTHPVVAREMAARYGRMSPLERLQIASGMYDTARAIILSTLPNELPENERNYRLFIRMHGEAFEPLARKAFLERGCRRGDGNTI